MSELAASQQQDPEEVLVNELVSSGLISGSDLERVSQMRQSQPEPASWPTLLVRLGLVAERDMANALSRHLNEPVLSLAELSADCDPEPGLSERFMRDNQVLPLQVENGLLTLAMADPFNHFLIDAVIMARDQQVRPRVAIGSEIVQVLDQVYGEGQSQMGDILADVTPSEDQQESVEELMDIASGAPVIRLVNLIIQRAVDARASDIHIEPFENQLKVRYRIDGVLQEGEAPPVQLSPAVISRVKIMARLNIAERRLPQDGRIEMRVQGKDLDMRVSTVPTMHGESVVLRLLNRESISFDFESLGFTEDCHRQLNELLAIPNGMILVTGPTGSGKTTTLYTALHQLNTPERKLITVEDPVEYQLAGINQIQVQSSIGLTFANALRSIVRQDPDVIMVGEMRDLETARICVQSALTGHLVLSTLHTNDAVSSITRLLEMGVEDYLLTSTLNAVLAQRLVRVLCPHCREPYEVLPEVERELGLSRFAKAEGPLQLWRASGCSHCQGTGFYGRLVIHELLQMNEEIRRLALDHADAGRMQAAARAAGMRTMYEDGCAKALQGLTNLEEVIRVTQE
ncbi:type II secretion system ATPase GspE [Marinobacterium sediminicola]|uniref:Type II secretion system protein E n=1 Tax=Marinobacterium sediminicola TaxID=518898 RepID=A0ABY1S510_9GAMM|nr:type II secretion system ATPase GspE [Marinobacterium sediminicola]ULG68431.1 type II secretion system ATPase GspE [Marinobacterium sediminicola]SMR78503.1 general secretion pathway protein E [Marinobacterium sediminicola]